MLANELYIQLAYIINNIAYLHFLCPRCLPPGPGEPRQPGGGLAQKPSREQCLHTTRDTQTELHSHYFTSLLTDAVCTSVDIMGSYIYI